MTLSATTTRPFAFDTEFDASGAVLRAGDYRPLKRAYSPTEVEVLLEQARAETRALVSAEIEGVRSRALNDMATALASAMPHVLAQVRGHREQAAELALATGRLLAARALEGLPRAALQAALDGLAREIDAAPRLVVAMAGLDEATRAEIEALCAAAGFTGVVRFQEAPAQELSMLASAAFVLEWADGRAAFDFDDAFARLEAAVRAALSAEATDSNMEGPPR